MSNTKCNILIESDEVIAEITASSLPEALAFLNSLGSGNGGKEGWTPVLSADVVTSPKCKRLPPSPRRRKKVHPILPPRQLGPGRDIVDVTDLPKHSIEHRLRTNQRIKRVMEKLVSAARPVPTHTVSKAFGVKMDPKKGNKSYRGNGALVLAVNNRCKKWSLDTNKVLVRHASTGQNNTHYTSGPQTDAFLEHLYAEESLMQDLLKDKRDDQ